MFSTLLRTYTSSGPDSMEFYDQNNIERPNANRG
jgi:hypothetical protein